MKRTLIGIACLTLLNTVHAGDMGAVDAVSKVNHDLIPFVTAEGFPVWINFGGITTSNNGVVSSVDTGNYLSGGGRGAAGFTYPYKSNIDFTAETGWNYFGHTAGGIDGSAISATLTGADLLVGAVYKTEFKEHTLEWFLKAGTLFQRIHYNYSLPNTYINTNQGLDEYLTAGIRGAISEFLPMIKLGVMYDINPRWAVTAAYMHAFGATPVLNSSLSKTTYVQASVVADLRAPTLNTAMFGVRYQLMD